VKRFKKALAGVTAATFIAGGALLAAPAQAADNGGGPTVYDVARDASKGRFAFDRNGGDFDILLAAVKVTGLKGALDDPNADLTVFAPTDAVFQATFGGRNEVATLFRALKAVNYDLGTLKTVLLYHVTGLNTDAEKGLSLAEVAAALGANGGSVDVDMLAGGSTTVTANPAGSASPANINNSNIVATDLFASNGVIHVIGDEVLLP
jgi:serralysin